MKALDTNVLIRFLVRDDEPQARAACEVIEEAERHRVPLWVGCGVVLECLWVLDTVYGCSREEILDAIGKLRMLAALDFENVRAVDEFRGVARSDPAELDDLWLGVLAKEKGCETVLTFDKKASRSAFYFLLK